MNLNQARIIQTQAARPRAGLPTFVSEDRGPLRALRESNFGRRRARNFLCEGAIDGHHRPWRKIRFAECMSIHRRITPPASTWARPTISAAMPARTSSTRDRQSMPLAKRPNRRIPLSVQPGTGRSDQFRIGDQAGSGEPPRMAGILPLALRAMRPDNGGFANHAPSPACHERKAQRYSRAFADEAANQKTAHATVRRPGGDRIAILQPAIRRSRQRHQERDESHRERDSRATPFGGRIRAERGFDRLAHWQGQVSGRG